MNEPIWVVVADPLTARVFFDCGIVDGLEGTLDGRLRAAFTFRRADAEPWAARLPAEVAAYHVDDLYPAQVAPPERVLRRVRPLARRADRLLPARDPPQPAARVPPRAHGARPPQLPARLSRVGPLPVRPRIEGAMRAWHFSPRRHVSSALRRRLERERPAIVLSNVQMQSATPLIVARAASRPDRRRATSRAGITPSARA